MAKSLDLVAIGRSSVDLYGEQVGGRLEDMASFAKYVGGSPTNTAIGLARLGLKSALVTRVGADHMGRFIREQLQREGVDVSAVVSDADRLTALVILGIRDREHFPLLFYRENCADMALDPGDIDEEQIRAAAAVLINGTHLSTDNVFEASMKAVRLARESGGRVIFDIDYRPVLWGLEGKDMGENRFVASPEVTERLREMLPLCDLIAGTEEEIHILGGTADTVAALESIRQRTAALLVCKLGASGCAAIPDDVPADLSDALVVPGFPVEVFNVLGAGDAFMAGFLSGWLRGEPLERCCVLANACGAIVVSRHGCAPAMPTREELDCFLARDDLPFRLREDKALEHLHWATTRQGDYDSLNVLAIDHRSQFDDLVQELDCKEAQISAFKKLAFDALGRVAGEDRGFGILVDDRFGFDVLAEAAGQGYWIGRPIEIPRSRPLEFEGLGDVGLEIGSWPSTHVVKCLVFYHHDDPPELRERQERQLVRLFAACRESGHELLLEVIAPSGVAIDGHSTARSLERLYDLGIMPDWWKLEPTPSAAAWRNISAVIAERDPYCRGIVLLGLSAPIPDLVESFEAAAPFPVVKGFAVGRSIFHDVAREWLLGDIGNEEAVEAMAARFSTLVEAWRSARARAAEAA
ncbi:MAG TPA: 5-dehydro-2-deoxygluconokinase [Sphingomicrobium sp.]|nr:5-dehydro-2-deoxygluconokinase [Sphingomicrobium sp.]